MEFTKKLVDLTVPEHKLAVFECAVSHADAQVEWYFNGHPVDQMETRKRFLILSIGEFRRMSIRNPLMHETDTPVACKWGELETSGKLFIIDCPYVIQEGLKNKRVPKNTNAQLDCKIVNNLAPSEITFKWRKNGEPLDLDANKDKYEFIVDGDKYILNIKDFNEKDVAEYEIYLADPDDYEVSSKAKIDLTNGLNDAEEIIEDLTISQEVTETEETLEDFEYLNKQKKKEPTPEPKFDYKLDDVHVRRKQDATFEMKMPNSKTKVKWLKDGKAISASSKYTMESGRFARLIILDSTLEDEGKYTAVIGDERVTAQLTVQDFVEILSPLKDQNLIEKETLKLSVQISDKNEPGVWLKDGKPIEPNENITIEVIFYYYF